MTTQLLWIGWCCIKRWSMQCFEVWKQHLWPRMGLWVGWAHARQEKASCWALHFFQICFTAVLRHVLQQVCGRDVTCPEAQRLGSFINPKRCASCLLYARVSQEIWWWRLGASEIQCETQLSSDDFHHLGPWLRGAHLYCWRAQDLEFLVCGPQIKNAKKAKWSLIDQ